jgi:MFS family permease
VYLSTVDKPATPPPGRRTRIAATVLALGTVSLITDVSSEMVTAILPLYLMLGLHLGPLGYGVVDGLYTGATALLRLVGGYLADRIRRRKAIAVVGYGLSAVAKLGLLAAGSSVPLLGGVIVADRAGKGLRTAPRDALITLSTPPDRLGRAFGVHRAMDSVGAFAGPLVAVAVLGASAQSFDAVFVTSFCIACLGVFVLLTFVPDHRGPSWLTPATTAVEPDVGRAKAAVSLGAALGLLRRRDFRIVVVAAAVMGLATIGDGFVYLVLQRHHDIAAGWFPLLAVGTNLAYLALAIPLGALADKVGRARVYLGGFAALAVVYLLLAAGAGGTTTLVVTVALYGAFYAATDGVLMAVAGPLLPEALKTTGIALVQSGQSLAYLGSSVLFGAAWQLWGPGPALVAAAGVALAALFLVASILLRGTTKHA